MAMDDITDRERAQVLAWCAAQLGPCRQLDDRTRQHAGARASVLRLQAASGTCYLKLHRDQLHWASEVHAYARWAPAFGDQAPRLLAVRDEPPLAIVVTAMAGIPLEAARLAPAQMQAAWHAAGRALAALHALPAGGWFGLCQRDGTPAATPFTDACAYVAAQYDGWLACAEGSDYLSSAERAIVQQAMARIPAFAGEHPVPCHYDYCPANWLVGPDGQFSAVIDFEFARWDLRVTDFSRYPEWEWIAHPDRLDAFFAGYGRRLSVREEDQLLVARVLYALGAIVWGVENAYRGYATEGRHALRHLAPQLAQ